MTSTTIAQRRSVVKCQRIARLSDVLYYDAQIAQTKSRVARLVTPLCMGWLERQAGEMRGMWPEEKLAAWEDLERELQTNSDAWDQYEAQARRGDGGHCAAMPSVLVCISGEVTG